MRNLIMAAMAIGAIGALALPAVAPTDQSCAGYESGTILASTLHTTGAKNPFKGVQTTTLDVEVIAFASDVGHLHIGLRDAIGAKDPFPGTTQVTIKAPPLSINPHRYFGPQNFKAATENANRAGVLLGLREGAGEIIQIARGSDKDLLKRPKKGGGESGPTAGIDTGQSGGIITT